MKRVALVTLTAALAACQGSIGSTPPINAPGGGLQPNSVGQVPGVGGPGASRAKTSEAIVKYAKDLTSIVFPVTEGYGLQIAIGSPSPVPSASAAGKAVSSPAAGGKRTGLAALSASPSAQPSLSPSPTPLNSGTASSSPGPSGSPAAGSSGSPAASPSTSPSSSPAAKKKTPAPPISVKLSVYPDLAPVAPTPDPDASPAPTPIANRTAIVRAYLKSPVTLAVASLDAFRFTVPADELDKTRGYTIALFSVPDKKNVAQSLLGSHKEPSTLLVFTTAAVADENGTIHAGTKGDPVTLAAGTGYAAILYADPRAIAAPVGGAPFGAPSPLPFNQTPLPGGMAQPQNQASGQPYPYGATAPPSPLGPISTGAPR